MPYGPLPAKQAILLPHLFVTLHWDGCFVALLTTAGIEASSHAMPFEQWDCNTRQVILCWFRLGIIDGGIGGIGT